MKPNRMSALLSSSRAPLAQFLAVVVLALVAGSVHARDNRGEQLDLYCATKPTGSNVPQQSRPYTARGNQGGSPNSCAICHPNGTQTGSFTNAAATATANCTTSGACPTTVDPLCVNTAPTGTPTITAPAAGSSVTAGSAVTFTGSGGTDPDGFALSYNWTFTNGVPPATGSSVTVTAPATGGTLTGTLEVRDAIGAAIGTRPTRSVTVTAAAAALAINPTSVSVPVGSTATSNVSNAVGAVTANPANTAVATATVAGNVVTVRGVTAGSTTVAVSDSRTNPVTQTLNVTVTAPPLAISPASVSVSVGSTATSTVSNAVGAVTATPANSAIATASVSGGTVTVTGVAVGSTTIAIGDSRTATQALSVTVTAPVLQGCRDNDRDGYSPDGGACGPRDCNDSNAAINPGAREVCGDGVDNDCDGQADSADRECNGTDCVGSFLAVPVVITRASWGPDDGVNQLKVEGNQAQPGAAVTLFNAATGALLGTTTVDSAGDDIGQWEFEQTTNAPPCRVRVSINGAIAERAVSNAPNCGAPPPPPANRPPVATITAPTGNVTRTQGQTVDFAGTGSDPDGNPITFAWTFQGATPSTATVADPAPVAFNTAGSFTVTLTVRDSLGATASATRTVTVTAPPLVANDDIYSVTAGRTLTVTAPGVLRNDTGGQLTAQLVTSVNSANLLTFNSDGSFIYTPARRFRGTDSFTYRVTNGTGTNATATVTITVRRRERGDD